jgi:hypothetical protein
MRDRIRCIGDPARNPWIATCCHLADRTSAEWIEVPVPGDANSDWLCPHCHQKGASHLVANKL